MKRCIHCNNAIDDHYRICPYCGEDQEFTSSLPSMITGNRPSVRHREHKEAMQRPRNYSLIVFIINGLLLSALSYLFLKQWKTLPLVFLVLLGLQYGLSLVSYGLAKFAFELKTPLVAFLNLVGDYSLPGLVLAVLILFGSFFIEGRLLQLALALDLVLILSASLTVLLGPAKRVYVVVVAFIYAVILIVLFIFRWFGLGNPLA